MFDPTEESTARLNIQHQQKREVFDKVAGFKINAEALEEI